MFPATDVGLYQWVGGVMVAYVPIAMLIQACRRKWGTPSDKHFIEQVFDAATFAMSIALFAGVVIEPTMLDLIGNTKPFLLISSFAGAVYGLKALAGF